ncbi:VCBS repeat-containing protein [Defluviimonas sp. WL0024]|uniref:VCBS repeat-containing protein n=2 Tax=Albidovulum TaxID=205889 RepID=A0ABT3J2H3_9RHOB|nr:MULTISPECIES: VCBS repeat-containing protein [Defluviimonas]MCU9847685.1 VCBS repeat-containing protein [Defluviimonas sp. WL0024]MCW3781887.1 VCBS repeat-containing protein [Defluviimonas salinarum]
MLRAALALLVALAASPLAARCTEGDGDWVRRACYEEPRSSGLYGHDILGATPEWSRIRVTLGPRGLRALRRGGTLEFETPDGTLFEDTAPRVADVDGDGRPELIVVQTDHRKGARLLAAGLDGSPYAATPFIGRRHRWLAPVGAADLDGDGKTEIAYVETPHLGKILKIVRLDGDRLAPVAAARGLTNHRIGDPFIQGRIASCGGRPTVLTADAGWSRIIGTTLAEGQLAIRDLGPYRDPSSFDRVAGCD